VGALARTVVQATQTERRRHQRVRVRLSGRFMRADRQEFACATIDISPGGVAFASDAPVLPGERVVAYMNQIGRIEGVVARAFVGGFAIQMKLPPLKREKLAEQLTWLANRQALGMPEDRRHERIAPRNIRTTVKLPSGREALAKIVDVSMSGAALTADIQAPIGSAVTVGATQAQIVRHFPGGLAVEFLRPIPAEEFSENIVL
jgi:hypothetical protein